MLVAIALGLVIWFLPQPSEVSNQGWLMLAIFIGTIAAIIGKAMPIGALSILAITLVAVTGVTSDNPGTAIKDALGSFSSPLIWLIAVAIMIARGLIKTGLGARISYYFILAFGKRSLGIGYSLALSELTLAPVTPSNTARGGGIMLSIAQSFDSTPEQNTSNKIGKYLALVNYHSNPITSAMFITATAPNPLTVKLIADATDSAITLSWTTWALAMLLPGLVAILLMPLVLYWLYTPEIKRTPDAKSFARENLEKLGRLGRNEKIMLLVFLYSHYFFASTTAHITAMMGAFLAVGLSLGAPPMLFVLLLAAASSIMMTLTHYATGTSPVVFGSNYVTLAE